MKIKRIILTVLSVLLLLFTAANVGALQREDGASDTAADIDVTETAGYIKWVDFDVTAVAMRDAYDADLESHGTDTPIPFAVSLAYLGAKYGGDFSRYKKSDLSAFCERVKSGEDIASITEGMQYFSYYREAYGAVLDGFVGEYTVGGETKYGLRVFSPIAAGYYYGDSDDFGVARSYGYKRRHLGHDMMGSVGTPIIAVESGYVEAVGWNQYGGWRIGIRSFDGKRYYYYAHLRKNHPYNDMYEGKIVTAGEVIGYLGMTGYSVKENVNNINTPHLHFGLQLIFDPSQKDGTNQIWIDVYELCRFLYRNRSEVCRDEVSGEYYAKNPIMDPTVPD